MRMKLSEDDLRGGLERDELIPYFQPLVTLSTGELSGFEVLARWQHPEHGEISPEIFIPIAEEHKLIGWLSQQVFAKAFGSAPLLVAPLFLTVNLSSLQLREPSLADDILALTRQFGFPSERLILEITESALLENEEQTEATIHALRAMGCRLALDDFGTGCSNLAQLRTLPFDMLKIDRSFVESMTKSRRSRKIVSSLIGLGRELGMMTVAEGVETESQADMLLWLGCQTGQGWLYGRPGAAVNLPGVVSAPAHPISEAFKTPGDDWAVSSLEALPTQRLAQLQAIYDGSPVALAFLDKRLRYLSLNDRYAAITRRSISAFLGKSVQEMVPEVFRKYRSYYDRALAGEAVNGVEIIRPTAATDGTEEMALMSFQPAFDENDEVIGVSVVVMDVAHWKRGADGLLQRQNPAGDLADLGEKVPWMMDAKGDSVEAEHCPRSSEWVPAVAVEVSRNLGWLEALHEDDLEPTITKMKAALASGEPIDVEYRVVAVDGGWKRVRSRGSARRGEMGEIVRWYGSVEELEPRPEPVVA
jgi:PAS domain S-box-containing protein